VAEIPGRGELEYTLRLSADGYVGPIREARIQTERLNVQANRVSLTVKRTGEEMERAGRGALEASTRVRMLGGVLISLSIQAFVAGLMFRRLRHQTFALERAKKRLRKAIEEHGPASEEAREAQERLRLIQEDLTWATREQTVWFAIAAGQMGVQIVRTYELIAGQKIQFATSLLAAKGHMKAGLAALFQAAATKKLAFAVGLATGGLSILLGYLAWTAIQAGRAENELNRLRETAGERYSTGLVKSFEDLTAVLKDFRTEVRIGGLTVMEPFDIDEALERYNAHVRREWRRLRR